MKSTHFYAGSLWAVGVNLLESELCNSFSFYAFCTSNNKHIFKAVLNMIDGWEKRLYTAIFLTLGSPYVRISKKPVVGAPASPARVFQDHQATNKREWGGWCSAVIPA